MAVLLYFGLFVVIAKAHYISYMEVPRYGDPNREIDFTCQYVTEKGDPPLHAIKWYQGGDEFFRYAPEVQPPIITFNISECRVTRRSCDMYSCTITVLLTKPYNTRLSFTCEVITGRPRFELKEQTKNLTVAAILEQDPVIIGLPGSAQLGEDLLLNCSATAAMPPANIMWYIDGKPESTDQGLLNNTPVSAPDMFGHRTSWRLLRLHVDTARSIISLRCEATQPTWPPYVRTTEANVTVARMLSASDPSLINKGVKVLIAATWLSGHIFSKYNA